MNQSVSRDRFHEVVHAYSGYVYTIAFRMLGNSADAEDAAQETFMKAYKRFATYKESLRLKNWLCTIALNTARDFYRKSHRHHCPTGIEKETSNVPGDVEVASQLGDRLDITKMLSVLDVRYRSVMMLYYIEQYSTKEIGTMLRKSESVVKIWLYRARKILLEKYGDSLC